VQIQPQHAAYAQLRDAVRRAEDCGVDIVFTWDHFFPLRGDPNGPHFECWSMLAAWAEQTERVEIGALVSAVGYRNPDLLADMARTVDHVSGGRLILGIGAGWKDRDYAEYGYPFGTPGTRLADLAAALPRIRARWARLVPPPVRQIPVLVGGGGERKTLRITAEHADVWHGFGDAATIAHKCAVLDSWCAQVGRDPASIARSTTVERRRPPEELAPGLLDAGVTTFVVNASAPDFDLAPVARWVAWRRAQTGSG
jgi:probable F420-dependent oxidoreductase